MELAEDALPFKGVDVWNAYEFTWLNSKGKPEVATARFRVPGDSPRLVESKSLKLYLGSFSNTRFTCADEVMARLESDLAPVAQAPVGVVLLTPEEVWQEGLGRFVGTSLDKLEIGINEYRYNPDFLEIEDSTVVEESLYTHLFRSLCPMTGQPDVASLLVRYTGNTVCHEGLLRYLVSYREHAEFAEQVTERTFVDIMRHCSPKRLVVTARYSRRGGIDINSTRISAGEEFPPGVRLWRQ